jgi:hypothetical protein
MELAILLFYEEEVSSIWAFGFADSASPVKVQWP